MRQLGYVVLAAVCVAGVSGDSEAGPFRRGARVVFKYKARSFNNGCRPVPQCSGTLTSPAPAVVPSPQSPAVLPGVGRAAPAPGDFLSALNAFRALHGRPPAAWDAGLAAFAAANRGVHTGRGWECWSGSHDLMQSLRMWIGSPSHASILLSVSVVGASPCPSGATLCGR